MLPCEQADMSPWKQPDCSTPVWGADTFFFFFIKAPGFLLLNLQKCFQGEWGCSSAQYLSTYQTLTKDLPPCLWLAFVGSNEGQARMEVGSQGGIHVMLNWSAAKSVQWYSLT